MPDFDFTQNIYLGFEQQPRPASVRPTISVSAIDVETAGDYAGSSHVLEMGRHYEHYVGYDWEAPKFLKVTGFPTASLLQLDMKARCPGVTGNIGETLTGIVACETLGCNAAQIAHLVVQSKQKTPDFLVNLTGDFWSLLKGLVPNVKSSELPKWWPIESKIRSGAITHGKVKEGLRQLVALWYRMRDDEPQIAGYGVVVAVGLRPPREIRIHFFIPQSKAKHQELLNFLSALGELPKFTDAEVAAAGAHLTKYA